MKVKILKELPKQVPGSQLKKGDWFKFELDGALYYVARAERTFTVLEFNILADESEKFFAWEFSGDAEVYIVPEPKSIEVTL